MRKLIFQPCASSIPVPVPEQPTCTAMIAGRANSKGRCAASGIASCLVPHCYSASLSEPADSRLKVESGDVRSKQPFRRRQSHEQLFLGGDNFTDRSMKKLTFGQSSPAHTHVMRQNTGRHDASMDAVKFHNAQQLVAQRPRERREYNVTLQQAATGHAPELTPKAGCHYATSVGHLCYGERYGYPYPKSGSPLFDSLHGSISPSSYAICSRFISHCTHTYVTIAHSAIQANKTPNVNPNA